MVKQVSPKDIPFPAFSARRAQGRIVNGNFAAPNQFPYQVSVRAFTGKTVSVCGGSIVSSRYILTAAHCTKSYATFEIGFGSNYLNAPIYRLTSSSKVEHPDFNSALLSNVSNDTFLRLCFWRQQIPFRIFPWLNFRQRFRSVPALLRFNCRGSLRPTPLTSTTKSRFPGSGEHLMTPRTSRKFWISFSCASSATRNVQTFSARRLSPAMSSARRDGREATRTLAWEVKVAFVSCSAYSLCISQTNNWKLFLKRFRRSDGHQWQRSDNASRHCVVRQQPRMQLWRSVGLHESWKVFGLDFADDGNSAERVKSSTGNLGCDSMWFKKTFWSINWGEYFHKSSFEPLQRSLNYYRFTHRRYWRLWVKF